MLTSIRFRTLTSCLALLLVAAGTAPAKPQALPFKGWVKATWDNILLGLLNPPATFVGGGPVTHMGITTQTGDLVLMPTMDPTIFTGFGSVTITAANGSTVSFDYEGMLFVATGEGIGTFTFTGGTGKFANVTGNGTFYALIDLSLPDNQPMTVELNGRITF
jgi:hypothetical protein